MSKPHGHSPHGKPSITYNAWHAMVQQSRKTGIACDESIRGFAGFLSFMGERPSGTTLERVSKDDTYRPGNLHWANRRHGKTYTSEYFIWSGMVARCEDENSPAYHNYGGRGITIHPAMRSFNGFLEVMGSKPSPRHTLDRWPNNNGDYEPGNVRWATRKQQSRNIRSNRPITLNGKTQLLCEWAEELGIAQITLSKRIDAYGWSVEEALVPMKFRAGTPKLTESDVLAIYSADGKHAEIAKRFNIQQSHVSRIKSGQAWASVTQGGASPVRSGRASLRT